MKFNFSSGITLAFGKCEPALKCCIMHRRYTLVISCSLPEGYHEI
jgi:hypothetical protein